MGCGQKKKEKLLVSVAVPLAPVRVHSQKPLAPCVALITSVANGEGDNCGGCADLPTFALQLRKTPENLS